MTISNSTRAAGPFVGNGSAASFPFSFKVFSTTDIVVVRADDIGQTTLVLNGDYTVQLNLDQDASPGGSVTLTAPLATGNRLVVTSNVAELQGTSLTNGGGFYPKVIEAAFDRATILIQQLRTIANRSLRFPLSDTGVDTELPPSNVRAGMLLGFDGNGKPTAVTPVAQSATGLQSVLASAIGAAQIGFLPTGIGATLTTLQSALNVFNQKYTGQFFAESGARINRINDRLFVGKSATQYDGKGNPTIKSWVGTPSGGIYEYLESNATFAAYAEGSGLGMFAAARSSATTGTGSEVSIGMAAFAHHDRANATSGVWCFYATALRDNANINGSTIGMEIDVANMGATVPISPSLPFQFGLTVGLSLAAGGETTNNFHAGISSAALTITSNDAALHAPVAQWEKGIVFHNKAIYGTDGASGTGIAIALATRHVMAWYNNAGNLTSYIYSGVSAGNLGTGIIFADDGMRIVSSTDTTPIFRVNAANGAANFLSVAGGGAGAPPVLGVNGTDANIDLLLQTKGTGLLQVAYGSATATAPANFSAARRLAIKDGNGITWYIPLATSPW